MATGEVIAEISEVLHQATGLELETIERMLSKPQSREHGDLAFPCFPLAKEWKLNPAECAKKLAAELELPVSLEQVNPIGPYLNFRYRRENFYKSLLPKILSEGSEYGKRPANGRRIIVEYSSVNIAKSFHVGHLRTTLIGHSLRLINEYLGFDVVSINHLGDWGTQFGFVFAGCEMWGKPENATVEQLVEIYQRANALKKAQEKDEVPDEDKDKPDVQEMARAYFRDLEAGDEKATEFWQWCLDISMVYLRAIYERLGIEFDHYMGESFYREMLPEVEEKIRESGILEDSRGALGVDCGKKLGFARIFTEDGRSLYITRDIATAMYREREFGAEEILYVVAAAQSLHFNQLVEILKRMKHPVAEKIVHVFFGFVPGMSTRAGGAISLKRYLDEAKSRALTAYKSEVSKKPEGVDEEAVAEKVAIGATYYYFLSHSNIKDFQFSWDEALNFQGESGPYLQYAMARINGIERKAKEEGISVDANATWELLREDSAFELAMMLSEFQSVVEKSREDREPYYIAQFLIDLARAFSKSYHDLRVSGVDDKELACARLSLFIATRVVLQIGAKLLGIPLVERM